jgi:hypothetical protein
LKRLAPTVFVLPSWIVSIRHPATVPHPIGARCLNLSLVFFRGIFPLELGKGEEDVEHRLAYRVG